ncbi:MAG: hypothetical protein AABX02_04330, partial [archaeon]
MVKLEEAVVAKYTKGKDHFEILVDPDLALKLKRGQAVNMASNQYGMFRQKGLDNQAALAATKVNMLQSAAAKVDEIIAGSKNP